MKSYVRNTLLSLGAAATLFLGIPAFAAEEKDKVVDSTYAIAPTTKPIAANTNGNRNSLTGFWYNGSYEGKKHLRVEQVGKVFSAFRVEGYGVQRKGYRVLHGSNENGLITCYFLYGSGTTPSNQDQISPDGNVFKCRSTNGPYSIYRVTEPLEEIRLLEQLRQDVKNKDLPLQDYENFVKILESSRSQ